MKYYLAKIEERNGEYEYETVIKFQTTGEPYKYLNAIAATWHGEPDEAQDKDSTGYYFNCGCVFVEAGGIQELSESAFNELTLITEM